MLQVALYILSMCIRVRKCQVVLLVRATSMFLEYENELTAGKSNISSASSSSPAPTFGSDKPVMGFSSL